MFCTHIYSKNSLKLICGLVQRWNAWLVWITIKNIQNGNKRNYMVRQRSIEWKCQRHAQKRQWHNRIHPSHSGRYRKRKLGTSQKRKGKRNSKKLWYWFKWRTSKHPKINRKRLSRKNWVAETTMNKRINGAFPRMNQHQQVSDQRNLRCQKWPQSIGQFMTTIPWCPQSLLWINQTARKGNRLSLFYWQGRWQF